MNMKKILILLFILLAAFGSFNYGEEPQKAGNPDEEVLTKTYFLEHVTALEVRQTLKPYYLHFSSGRSDSDMFTVLIHKDKIGEFERLLKKIDAEKKQVLFRIFTVIASNNGKGDGIKNKDLKRVLEELKGLLSFDSYRLDGASFMTVKEDSENPNKLELISKVPGLKLMLHKIKVRGEQPGKRTIDIKEIYLSEYKTTLIQTGTSIKENGYLVAGVSRIGKNGDALVLVINAEIR